ncbi:hypothetical protein BHS09_04040 [Myxococcus xanthus]|uniref:Uncharacterized protein n=2 Tax=Myxococcus xanthus TaxID=34 RepID=A0AAE6KQH5_MYXXA|nr:hypothetical protein BHS09_04040 [Myxococcus xanthus]QDE73505.1 hypothetical protein BHS08_04045 [Myxococcus xanthus]
MSNAWLPPRGRRTQFALEAAKRNEWELEGHSMGRGWAWVGMLGLFALTTGCREREPRAAVVTPSGVEADMTARAIAREPAMAVNSATEPAALQPAMEVQERAPRMNTPARAPTALSDTSVAPLEGAPVRAPAPVAESSAPRTQQQATASRVMIGSEAVQAREDEDWYLGAARAAQDATVETGQGGSGNAPLEDVIIASSAVNGRVTQVKQNTITVKDLEGGVYELELDQRSRGLRQGRKVPLRQLREGTPVRAQFVLMGGRAVARDVQIHR